MLDRLADAGVTTAVVNVHYFPDQVEAHLSPRHRPRVLFSDERGGLLDSGGGIAHAAPLLGTDPIFVANIDNIWREGATPALETLKAAWDPARMDVCILLAPRGRTYGFERPEGFIRDEQGRLTHSNSTSPLPPFNNVGIQILKPGVVSGEGAFSIVPLWKRLAAEGRLYGAVMDGFAMHVSDPAGRYHVERSLLEGAEG